MRFFIVAITLLLSKHIYAHPTSFEGSKGLMGSHSPNLSHVQLNYSFRYYFAGGLHYFRRSNLEDNNEAQMASANFLVKRWNGSSYQGNLYAVLGAGNSNFSGEDKNRGMGLLQFDIEDREYYFLTKYMEIGDGSETDLSSSVIRFGITPYVGSFTDLHTWIIFQWETQEFINEEAKEDVTPFVRLFYNNVLIEIGQSFDGVTKFNYISHF